eukprot:2769662-Prymnesium_polylepis.1
MLRERRQLKFELFGPAPGSGVATGPFAGTSRRTSSGKTHRSGRTWSRPRAGMALRPAAPSPAGSSAQLERRRRRLGEMRWGSRGWPGIEQWSWLLRSRR